MKICVIPVVDKVTATADTTVVLPKFIIEGNGNIQLEVKK